MQDREKIKEDESDMAKERRKKMEKERDVGPHTYDPFNPCLRKTDH